MIRECALLTIDVQLGFLDSAYWGPRNNPDFEKNISKIMSEARFCKIQVIHIQHLSTEDNSPLNPQFNQTDFMDCAKPHSGEVVLAKSVNSAFIGTNLEDYLRTQFIKHLYMVGLTSDHCVSTTARMAANLGFKVTLIEQALATHDRYLPDGTRIPAQLVHQVSMASLHKEFARVMTLDDASLEWRTLKGEH